MGKKESKSKKVRLTSPRILFFACLAAGAVGLYWAWDNNPALISWKEQVVQYIDNQEVATLESRYTPEQIMQDRRSELLDSSRKSFQAPLTKYYPYLLFDVKYTEDNKPREGVVLWGLTDGEIVLNTDTWETTHGFRDCLECQASRNELKIIQALAQNGSPLTIDELQKTLKIDREVLQPWVDSAKQKHLIVQNGQKLQLHFENPRFLINPHTKLKQQLVTKPLDGAQKAARNFTRHQIVQMAHAAFGNDFTIRNEREIFLPAYRLEVLNPDGSISATEWNALTARPL
ncbi:MAG: hypothetical protein LW832_10955 [Parachlamydia sp.]|jgi:hypothetical protein|nr:hypothetical protein [Parachlamydia sp.]